MHSIRASCWRRVPGFRPTAGGSRRGRGACETDESIWNDEDSPASVAIAKEPRFTAGSRSRQACHGDLRRNRSCHCRPAGIVNPGEKVVVLERPTNYHAGIAFAGGIPIWVPLRPPLVGPESDPRISAKPKAVLFNSRTTRLAEFSPNGTFDHPGFA
jgi:hypothetical protein